MKWIVGIDECGTGAWAGPIIVGAVVARADWQPHPLVKDSKDFTGTNSVVRMEARERVLLRHIKPHVRFCKVAQASAPEIAEYGQRVCWVKLVRELMKECQDECSGESLQIIVDGGAVPELQSDGAQFQVGADSTIPAVKAASIAAKVWRDKTMLAIDAHYPGYGFAEHMGYGTALHREAIAARGACAEHRMSIHTVCDLDRIARLPKVV